MHRLALREGWSTVLLVSAVVYIAVWSILRADWADGLRILNLVAFVGLAAGLAVAKARSIPSLVAHALAMVTGALVILYQMTEYLDDRIGTRRQKLSWLWDRGSEWLSQVRTGERTDDLYLFVLFISIVTFVLAYTSMWFVIRARWIWAALVLPGLLLFINLGYSLRVPTSYVAFYMFFALLLLMRFTLLQRETVWRRMHIGYPASVVWHGMWAATYLAIAVIVFGWVFPASARSAQAHDLWLEVDGPWRSVEARFNDWFAGLRGPGGGGIGGYASFSDSFDLGGPLRLSDAPVVLVTGEPSAPYLAAHRYSVYTGRGWESALAGEDEPEIPTPQIELRPGEPVPGASSQTDFREEADYILTVQRPRGDIVFAPETFLSSDIGVNLVVPRRTVNDGRIDLIDEDPVETPVELQPLITLLREFDFSPDPIDEEVATPVTGGVSRRVGVTPTPEPTPTPAPPAPASAEIRAEQQRLAQQGITTDYTIDEETYRAEQLIYSGTFAEYDDVEAVRARDGLSRGTQYSVTTLVSTAISDELRQVPAKYPDDILARYLQLPETVTPRTKELALDITADAATPFDKARAVEVWLRANIAYSEDIEFPPEDRDVVDYVLFDSKQGYCEYYASSFVVMMRSLGVPARMVTGFFPADRDDDAGGFLYRERNAHAWPEVYFADFGWIPFEPTANRTEISRDPVQESSGPASNRPLSTGDGLLLPEDEILAERGGGLSGSVPTASAQSDPVTPAEWALRMVFVVLMIATLVVAYLWLRGLRGLTPAVQLYAKAERGASWGGIRRDPSMTPHEYARLVARTVPGSRAPATFLTDLYVSETYGHRRASPSDLRRARRAWAALRGLLLKHLIVRLRPWSTGRADEDDAE